MTRLSFDLIFILCKEKKKLVKEPHGQTQQKLIEEIGRQN